MLDGLVEQDFEARWAAASVAVRRKHILVGLSEACSISDNLNHARCFTGDILLLDHLSTEGKVFLELIKLIIHDREAETLQNFPGETWEKFVQSEESEPSSDEVRKIMLSEMKILRTLLIYYVVLFTMLSFTGYPRPTIPVQKHRFDLNVENQLANVEKAERATIYGKAAAKQMKKEDWAGFLERNSRRKVVCDNCLKPQTPEQKYPRCARC
ncbi:hypothetical protein BT96DRAFT_237492 [Gymnopus androsaceus JB14]|uniref:Uncharacterized protein n=1 Tax=Gymnopus androsaceus JB14 TaxID=1447944 RepID=A0A6A4IJP4_9AGAR|nr:hypothetical protein BT96DRAFT_237492 [Gymnopus androsaceus JB14]